MSISNQHGGGLTVDRIVGEDFNKFEAFIYSSSYADRYPPMEKVIEKSVTLLSPFDPSRFKNGFVKRLLAHFEKTRISKSIGAYFIVKRLSELYNLHNTKWVVSPQAEISVYIIARLKRKFKIEYLTWVMDDHLVKLDGGGLSYPPHIRELMRAHLTNSIHNFVISPAMGSYYRKTFNAASSVLFGPVLSEVTKARFSRESGVVKLIYFGAITDWQLDPLEYLISLLPKLDARLDIYSAKDNIPHQLRSAHVMYKGSIMADMIIQKCSEYDAVLLPISFKTELAHLSLLNIATKMSECLASGKPTIIIGPPDAAMVRYTADKECAIVLDRLEESYILNKLKILNDLQAIVRITENAKQLVQNELTKSAMQNTWRKGLHKLLYNSK